jgi:hypothetical protein
MLSPGRKVIAMKALKPLAAAVLAAFALLAASPMVEAQGSPRGGGSGGSFEGGAPRGGGSFQGAPQGGRSFEGGPSARGGGYRGSYPTRDYRGHGYARGGSTFFFGFYGPGYWWGPGYYWPRYGWGPGYWGPVYVYPGYPYYGYYPPIYESPPVYVERDPPAQPAEPAWWYWCAEAKAYYPYVKECPGGWQRVPPQPVPPASR